ncbi:uncharacterized protein LOC143200033 [Rhynchophorus ferrugineus]|uniref:uncharacterized protein LOC143200033 n=1 Tax=Rhynchophorus ferrugineus TaxID=354439 RepID=UPI003FCD6BF9
MATTNRVYILAAFVISGIAVIFNIISLSTQYWITAKITDLTFNTATSSVNYGLFRGSYERAVPSPSVYDVQMTCSFGENVCMLLCGDKDYRKFTLNEIVTNDVLNDTDYVSECNKNGYNSKSLLVSNLKTTENDKSLRTESDNKETKHFINAGVWLSTVVCLILATFIGLISSALAFYNTISNPIQFYFSVGSLYIYNALAFSFTLLYMIFWGALYNIVIFHEVGLADTLVGSMTSDKNAVLGYSYWISFVPLLFYGGSIGVLFYRDYLNAKDPKNKTVHLEESTDPNIYLY